MAGKVVCLTQVARQLCAVRRFHVDLLDRPTDLVTVNDVDVNQASSTQQTVKLVRPQTSALTIATTLPLPSTQQYISQDRFTLNLQSEDATFFYKYLKCRSI